MPKLIGTANNSAIREVIRVPAMAISAPYSSFTGSHSMRVIKPGPKCSNAGHAPKISEITIPIRVANTSAAKLKVSAWKSESCHLAALAACVRPGCAGCMAELLGMLALIVGKASARVGIREVFTPAIYPANMTSRLQHLPACHKF